MFVSCFRTLAVILVSDFFFFLSPPHTPHPHPHPLHTPTPNPYYRTFFTRYKSHGNVVTKPNPVASLVNISPLTRVLQ